MSLTRRARWVLFISAVVGAAFAATASAQQTTYPKPTELPNPIVSSRAGRRFLRA